MKFLHNVVQKVGTVFDPQKKGKLSFFHYLYEAIESFLFVKAKRTTGSVHVRDAIDYKRMMMAVCYALVPCVVMAMYNTGYQANAIMEQAGLGAADVPGWRGVAMNWCCTHLYDFTFSPNDVLACLVHGAFYFFPIYLVTMVVGGCWEVLFALVRKHEVNEGFFVTGLLFPLTLPATIPLWQVAVGISFGVVVGKEIFGGTGRNFFNPALTGRVFLFFAYAGQISGDTVWAAVDWAKVKAANLPDAISGATPLTVAMNADTGGVRGLGEAGYTWVESFVGRIPGSLGETSTVACLIGLAMLLYFGVASWRIMLSMTVGAAAMSTLFWCMGSETNAAFDLGPHWHLILGGFAFGAVFMATDPVTSSMTRVGQYLYGALIGILVLVVRVLNPAYPEGVMLAILFGNVTAPLIDYYVVKANINRRIKRVAVQ